MQYVPHMAVLALLVSFFKNGYFKENTVQMQVILIIDELLNLKENFSELQKDIANVRRGLNQDVLEIHKLIGNWSKTVCHFSRRDGVGDQNELSTPNANEMCGPSLSNDDDLKKLDMILKGLAKEKATRINFVKANEAMEDTFRQNLSYLATEIENVRKNIDNRIIVTNANAATIGINLENKVSTIERKIQVIMSNLNKSLEDLEEHEKWHRDQNAQCADGWRKFSTSCYTFIHIKMPWFNAEQYCQLFGSHLIRIDDDAEFQFIDRQLKELHSTKPKDVEHDALYWTAGNDIMKEGHYVWTPLNIPISYQAWFGEEPNNNGGQENCVEIAYHRNFKMNDHYCKHNFFFICEIDRKNG